MDADLKALHDAVTDLLKARRAVKRAANQLRLRGGSYGGGGGAWDRIHILHQLEGDCDSAEAQLMQAQAAVLAQWEVLKPLL